MDPVRIAGIVHKKVVLLILIGTLFFVGFLLNVSKT